MKYQTEFIVKVKNVNKNIIFTLITSLNTYTLGNEKIKKITLTQHVDK